MLRDHRDPPAADARMGLFGPGVDVSGRSWAVATAVSALSVLIIGIPTRVVPNGFFRRMTPTRPLDYAFLAVASVLIGLTFALRPRRSVDGNVPVFAGGLATVLAVGCPICNKVVVALLGTAGALSIFAPIQPVLGGAGIALLVWALRRRLRDLRTTECRVPPDLPLADAG